MCTIKNFSTPVISLSIHAYVWGKIVFLKRFRQLCSRRLNIITFSKTTFLTARQDMPGKQILCQSQMQLVPAQTQACGLYVQGQANGHRVRLMEANKHSQAYRSLGKWLVGQMKTYVHGQADRIPWLSEYTCNLMQIVGLMEAKVRNSAAGNQYAKFYDSLV